MFPIGSILAKLKVQKLAIGQISEKTPCIKNYKQAIMKKTKKLQT